MRGGRRARFVTQFIFFLGGRLRLWGPMTERLPLNVSWQTLGTLLELEKPTVCAYAEEGVFIRAGRNKYLLAPSVRNYVRKLREIAAGRAGDQLNAVDENARLKIVQRRNYELKNAALEGTLVPMEDLVDAWGAIVRTIKAMVLSIPVRCQEKLPHLKG